MEAASNNTPPLCPMCGTNLHVEPLGVEEISAGGYQETIVWFSCTACQCQFYTSEVICLEDLRDD